MKHTGGRTPARGLLRSASAQHGFENELQHTMVNLQKESLHHSHPEVRGTQMPYCTTPKKQSAD